VSAYEDSVESLHNQAFCFGLRQFDNYAGFPERRMKIKKLVVEFATVFPVVLVLTAIVTFLWNIVGHGATTIDWEASFRFAIILGIVLTWVKSGETKEYSILDLVQK
jgi:hypothetical protein